MTANSAGSASSVSASVAPDEVVRQRKEALREITSILPSLALGATGACYALGLLIVNIYLNRYGVYTIELVRSDFILVGAVFVFLVAVATTGAAHGKIILARFPDSWKQKKLRVRVWQVTSVLLQSALAFVGAPIFALTAMARQTWVFDKWQVWIAALLLTGTGTHAINLFRRGVWIVREALQSPDAVSSKSQLGSQVYFALDVVVSLSLSIAAYALLAYPFLAPAFGGGHRDLVMLSPTTEGTAVAKHLKLQIDANGDIGPVKLLSDNQSELTIVAGDDSSANTRAIRIKRDAVNAIVAIPSDPGWSSRRSGKAAPKAPGQTPKPTSPKQQLPAPTTQKTG